MPGRGQPWKKGGHVDDTIQSEDIEDGTIAEVDLNTALQAKVNSASGHEILDEGSSLPTRGRLDFVGAGVVASDGVEDTTTVTIAGGGGAFDFTNTFLLQEDFEWAVNSPSFLEKYVLQGGTLGAGGVTLSNFGIAGLATAGAVAGQTSELSSDGGFVADPSKADITMRQGVSVPFSLPDVVAVCATLDGLTGGGYTTQAGFFIASGGDGFGFIYDPSVSLNWQIWASKAGVQTITVTSIPVTTAFIQLEADYVLATTTVTYKINGVVVGTINTNVPNTVIQLSMYSSCSNKTTTQTFLDIDYWEFTGTRSH